MTGHRASLPADQDSNLADDAFEVHCALIRAEQANPTLRQNPHWTILRMEAYAEFALAMRGEL